MAGKRKSATEPVQDDVVVKAELIEEELAPQQGLNFEEAEAARASGTPEEVIAANSQTEDDKDGSTEGDTISERVLTPEERKLEVTLILAGIKANREAILKQAESRVAKIQSEVTAMLHEYDELTRIYSDELAELRKGEGTKQG